MGTVNELENLGQMPQQFYGQLQGIANSYSSGLGNVFTSAQYSTGVLPYQTATVQAVQNYTQDYHTLDSQRQALEAELINLTQQLQSATTEAAVNKLSGAIASINGQLNSVNQRLLQSAQNSVQEAQKATATQQAVFQGEAVYRAQLISTDVNAFMDKIEFDNSPVIRIGD
jgi:hypothetical protein